MPMRPPDRHATARRPPGPIAPESLPLHWLKVSLTLCVFTLAALACCHLIVTTLGGSSNPGPP